MPSNTQPIYGNYYRELHGKAGWFNSPRVPRAFGVNFALEPEDRKQAIKSEIYTATGVDSLAKLPPADFVRLIASKGLAFTLPTTLKAAGVGQC